MTVTLIIFSSLKLFPDPNQGYVFAISGRHMEPPPAFSEVIKGNFYTILKIK